MSTKQQFKSHYSFFEIICTYPSYEIYTYPSHEMICYCMPYLIKGNWCPITSNSPILENVIQFFFSVCDNWLAYLKRCVRSNDDFFGNSGETLFLGMRMDQSSDWQIRRHTAQLNHIGKCNTLAILSTGMQCILFQTDLNLRSRVHLWIGIQYSDESNQTHCETWPPHRQ